MFSLLYGGFIFVVALVFMLFIDKKGSKIWGLIILVATIFLMFGVADISSPHFNKPLQPTRLTGHDTLYVAPKDGVEGLVVTVKTDSTGTYLISRAFVAQHTVPPTVVK